MADKRKLVDDPNTPYDDTQILARPPRLSVAAARNLALTGDQGSTDRIQQVTGEPPVSTPAPRVRRPDPALDSARQYGQQVGQASNAYLGEREALAPGVRRWGSTTADPSDVYMTVDRNGNRVYTDDADFAASQSRGRLTRRDLAPGMLASDADRTLNDPDGGFTYAPAPGKALDGLRQASARTRGGSQTVQRALAEAERAQAIADTRAGTRDIDERRATEGRRLRRQLQLPDGEGNLDPRVLIALQRLGLDERKFAAEREDKASDRDSRAGSDALSAVKGTSDLIASVQKGEIDPQSARDLLASLPGEQGKRGARGLRKALLQQLLTEKDPFFLGADEIQYADPASIRHNQDGTGTFTEADDGFFDIQRNIDLSPEELSRIYGDDADMVREDELNSRLRRGY